MAVGSVNNRGTQAQTPPRDSEAAAPGSQEAASGAKGAQPLPKAGAQPPAQAQKSASPSVSSQSTGISSLVASDARGAKELPPTLLTALGTLTAKADPTPSASTSDGLAVLQTLNDLVRSTKPPAAGVEVQKPHAIPAHDGLVDAPVLSATSLQRVSETVVPEALKPSLSVMTQAQRVAKVSHLMELARTEFIANKPQLEPLLARLSPALVAQLKLCEPNVIAALGEARRAMSSQPSAKSDDIVIPDLVLVQLEKALAPVQKSVDEGARLLEQPALRELIARAKSEPVEVPKALEASMRQVAAIAFKQGEGSGAAGLRAQAQATDLGFPAPGENWDAMFATADLDALVYIVMMMGAKIEKEELRDQLKEMHALNEQKKAMRERNSHMKSEQARIQGEIQKAYKDAVASGAVDPNTTSQTDWELQTGVTVSWDPDTGDASWSQGGGGVGDGVGGDGGGSGVGDGGEVGGSDKTGSVDGIPRETLYALAAMYGISENDLELMVVWCAKNKTFTTDKNGGFDFATWLKANAPGKGISGKPFAGGKTLGEPSTVTGPCLTDPGTPPNLDIVAQNQRNVEAFFEKLGALGDEQKKAHEEWKTEVEKAKAALPPPNPENQAKAKPLIEQIEMLELLQTQGLGKGLDSIIKQLKNKLKGIELNQADRAALDEWSKDELSKNLKAFGNYMTQLGSSVEKLKQTLHIDNAPEVEVTIVWDDSTLLPKIKIHQEPNIFGQGAMDATLRPGDTYWGDGDMTLGNPPPPSGPMVQILGALITGTPLSGDFGSIDTTGMLAGVELTGKKAKAIGGKANAESNRMLEWETPTKHYDLGKLPKNEVELPSPPPSGGVANTLAGAHAKNHAKSPTLLPSEQAQALADKYGVPVSLIQNAWLYYVDNPSVTTGPLDHGVFEFYLVGAGKLATKDVDIAAVNGPGLVAVGDPPDPELVKKNTKKAKEYLEALERNGLAYSDTELAKGTDPSNTSPENRMVGGGAEGETEANRQVSGGGGVLRSGTFAQFSAAVDAAQNDLDALSDLTEERQLRLQMVTDRVHKLMETLSNYMKKTSETMGSIVANLK